MVEFFAFGLISKVKAGWRPANLIDAEIPHILGEIRSG